MILSKGRELTPIEIKAGVTFDPSFSKNIKLFQKLSDDIKSGYVVYGGDKRVKIEDTEFIDFREISTTAASVLFTGS